MYLTLWTSKRFDIFKLLAKSKVVVYLLYVKAFQS